MSHGVSFPVGPDGDRSTTSTGRGVAAAALRAVDPVGARSVEHKTAWRSRYLQHFRRLVEAGLGTPEAWWSIADAGLAAVHDRMVVLDDAGAELPMSTLLGAPSKRALTTVEVKGQGSPAPELLLPYHGQSLRGDGLRDQLLGWDRLGVLEPSAVDAVMDVVDHPEWLRLDGHTAVVLGAGAAMGPIGPLLRWGARVAAVDLPRPGIWERVLRGARASAGALLVPTDSSGEGDLAAIAGADLLTEVPEIADWLAGLDGGLVVGNYLYADGGTHVRLSAATDLLAQRLCSARDDTALAFLATPTDVFVVPGDAVEQSALAYRNRSRTAKVVGRPRAPASPCLSTRRRPGDRRCARAGAGTELRAGQTDSAVASGGRAS